MIFIILVLLITGFIWLILTFIELPVENPHEFDAMKYWQDKERKWGGKQNYRR